MTREEAQAEADRLESEAMTRGQSDSIQASTNAMSECVGRLVAEREKATELLAEMRGKHEILRAIVLDACGHLGAAISQSIPTDDQMIMEHVRSAKGQIDLLIERW
jgi:hypothetical protein